jgi:beta-1,4-N-acetylglucosaminyltransferase
MHVFLTIGSTRFDALIASAFTERVLSSLRKKGYTSLVIQCGNSAFEFSSKVQNGETQTLSRAGVDVEFWKFKPSLQEDYEKADLVISHAGEAPVSSFPRGTDGDVLGSGTILDVLRMPKPMIVVPNPTLLDNHQEELASVLEEMGHLKATTVE